MKTVFADTNFFLSFLVRNEAVQKKKARELFEGALRGEVSLITSSLVLFEIDWVLYSTYRADKGKRLNKLQEILNFPFLKLDDLQICAEAITLARRTALELQDCYNLAYAKIHGCEELATFDKKLLSYLKREPLAP
ncbi:PIN domain-containing protein [Patescibacteria group bacterium]|nr:PIN domain-containing protein [Patescibacteria group bacterium]